MKKTRRIKKIQREIFRTLMILVSVMTVLIAAVSIAVNVRSESEHIDQNLENTAYAAARSQGARDALSGNGAESERSLKSLEDSLTNIDVISVVGADGIRRYHSNRELIGTIYDGTLPSFETNGDLYVTSDIGPSGSQRRAYAAIYDGDGNYLGFVLAVMLNRNIHRVVLNTIAVHLLCAAAVILCAAALSCRLSGKIKSLLLGYEPDIFSAMFRVRDNILESLEEGLIATDAEERVIFINKAARRILCLRGENPDWGEITVLSPALSVKRAIETGERCLGLSVHPAPNTDVLADILPVTEQGTVVGALCILRDRTEYTRIMEDLSGVNYLVESMRANNHDFINKLHVILGLIQMGSVKEASEYIANITSIRQTVIHNIMKNIEDPSVAALLIGKYARAAELNIRFTLKSGSRLSRSDISLMSGDLVTIIGNLLDNAMDAMNSRTELPKELSIGIFTEPHAMLISVDDTGPGIAPENRELIFKDGFSTKGKNRGTGLYVVSALVEKYGGTILADSEEGVGTSFTVTLTDAGSRV